MAGVGGMEKGGCTPRSGLLCPGATCGFESDARATRFGGCDKVRGGRGGRGERIISVRMWKQLAVEYVCMRRRARKNVGGGRW